MRRRDFITLLGGAAAWPLAARAQQPERVRRIGVLTPFAANDAEGQARLTAFAQGLQHAGWIVGQNIRIEYRWGDGKANTMRKYATDLVTLAPDVILASSSAAVAPLLEVTRTIPIVFAGIGDPVAGGYVESQARPGGNATGFTVYEYSIGGKWLELLKEVAPRVSRIAVLRDSTVAAGPGQFGAVQALAPSIGVDLRPVDVRDAGEIERAVTAFAQSPNGGLVVFGSPGATIHRDLIVTLAAKHRLPATYSARYFATAGGLISYGPSSGLVASLARPGGNVTGLSMQTTDLAGKRFELLREILPDLRRLAIMAAARNAGAMLEMAEVQAAARTLGIDVVTFQIRQAEDIAPTFEAFKSRADALYIPPDPLITSNRVRIHTLALLSRLPTMHGFRELVEAGGLMSYGPNQPDLYRRAAEIVDKILRGTKPADIPVEQPTKFDLVINLTTAKALGLDVPPTLLARADEVIE